MDFHSIVCLILSVLFVASIIYGITHPYEVPQDVDL